MKSYEFNKQLMNGQKFTKNMFLTSTKRVWMKQPVTISKPQMPATWYARGPRLLMTRKVQTISKDIFINVVDQLKPWTQDEWAVGNILSENLRYFTNCMRKITFFYIIPKVIQLHGYGDPLLDKHMHTYVPYLTEVFLRTLAAIQQILILSAQCWCLRRPQFYQIFNRKPRWREI